MQKNVFLAAMLGMALVSVPLFAQASANAVSLDVAPLFKGFIASETGKDGDKDTTVFGIGANYERLIAPHYSIGIGLDFYSLTYDKLVGTYFGMAAQGRWYSSEVLEKFFLGTNIGFSTFLVKNDGTTIEAEGFTGFSFALEAGYKLAIKKVYVEPSLGYVLAKTSTNSIASVIPIGWQLGLCIGMAF